MVTNIDRCGGSPTSCSNESDGGGGLDRGSIHMVDPQTSGPTGQTVSVVIVVTHDGPSGPQRDGDMTVVVVVRVTSPRVGWVS